MKNIYIATVGKSAQPIIDGYRIGPMDSVYLLHSGETKTEADAIVEYFSNSTLRENIHLVNVNPFEFQDTVAMISRIHKDNPDCALHLNMTGGTNIMASATLFAGMITRSKVFYLRQEIYDQKESLEDRIIDIPTPKVALNDLNETEKETLKILRAFDKGSIKGINSSIGSNLGLSGQLMSYHLKQLEKKELVSIESEGRQKRVTLTDSGRFLSELM